MISAGAVAKDGIARNTGDSSRDSRNRIAVVMEVRPVLPPSVTPDALSTKVVVVEVPITAPAVVATASAIKAPLCWQSAFFIQHVCLGSHTDQGSQSIKNIHEQKCENDHYKLSNRNGCKVKLHKDRSQARNGQSCGEVRQKTVISDLSIRYIQAGKLTDNAQKPGDQNTPRGYFPLLL